MNVIEVSQLLFTDDTGLVNIGKMLYNLVMEFGKVCDIRKLKVNDAKSIVMRCTGDRFLRGADIGFE